MDSYSKHLEQFANLTAILSQPTEAEVKINKVGQAIRQLHDGYVRQLRESGIEVYEVFERGACFDEFRGEHLQGDSLGWVWGNGELESEVFSSRTEAIYDARDYLDTLEHNYATIDSEGEGCA